MSITKPHTFTPQTKIISSHVNQNFDVLYDGMNAVVEQLGDTVGDVRHFMDGKSGRPTYANWFDNQNSVNVTACIQAAIDYMSLVGGGEVRLPAGTYLIGARTPMTQVGGAPACDTILVPRSNVSIVGQGYATELRVANGFSTGGDYVVFGTEDLESTDAFTFRSFRINGNGTNNLHPGGAAVRRACAIWLYKADKINIENMWFTNNPGLNTIKIGSDSMSYRGTNCVIRGCWFRNQGGAVAGNRNQPDHSSIYVSGDNILIDSNDMLASDAPFDAVNVSPVSVCAAIELHGTNLRVTNNHVVNYSGAGYSVNDTIVGGSNHVWRGNQFLNITNVGISLWSPSSLTGITIDGNEFTAYTNVPNFTALVYQSVRAPDTTVGVSGLSITGNRFSATNLASTSICHAIFLSAVDDVLISGNSISNFPSSGIRIYDIDASLNTHASSLHNSDITIVCNSLSNCNFYDVTVGGINLDNASGATVMDTVRIFGNTISHVPALTATIPTNLTTDTVEPSVWIQTLAAKGALADIDKLVMFDGEDTWKQKAVTFWQLRHDVLDGLTPAVVGLPVGQDITITIPPLTPTTGTAGSLVFVKGVLYDSINPT